MHGLTEAKLRSARIFCWKWVLLVPPEITGRNESTDMNRKFQLLARESRNWGFHTLNKWPLVLFAKGFLLRLFKKKMQAWKEDCLLKLKQKILKPRNKYSS